MLCDPRGTGWGEAQEGVYIYIYIYIYKMTDSHCLWQKPTQHCKAIILQLKNKLKKKAS